MVHMDEGRINKRIFAWGDKKAGRGCKNHTFQVKENLRKLGFGQYSDVRRPFSRNALIAGIEETLTSDFIAEWLSTINRESGR